MMDSENKKPSNIEGRRSTRLVASEEATFACAIHLVRNGHVGMGVDPTQNVLRAYLMPRVWSHCEIDHSFSSGQELAGHAVARC